MSDRGIFAIPLSLIPLSPCSAALEKSLRNATKLGDCTVKAIDTNCTNFHEAKPKPGKGGRKLAKNFEWVYSPPMPTNPTFLERAITGGHAKFFCDLNIF